jgi:hypothetical protein
MTEKIQKHDLKFKKIYLSYVIAVNTANKTGTSSTKTSDVGIYLTYLMKA